MTRKFFVSTIPIKMAAPTPKRKTDDDDVDAPNKKPRTDDNVTKKWLRPCLDCKIPTMRPMDKPWCDDCHDYDEEKRELEEEEKFKKQDLEEAEEEKREQELEATRDANVANIRAWLSDRVVKFKAANLTNKVYLYGATDGERHRYRKKSERMDKAYVGCCIEEILLQLDESKLYKYHRHLESIYDNDFVDKLFKAGASMDTIGAAILAWSIDEDENYQCIREYEFVNV